MKLAKVFASGICSFALASAAWAGGGLHSQSSSSMSSEWPSASSEYSSVGSEFPSSASESGAEMGSYAGSPWGAVDSDSSATESMEPELLSSSEPQQFVIVEEWYIFPSNEEIPLGG